MWCTMKAKQINGPIWHSEAILVDLQDGYWQNSLWSSHNGTIKYTFTSWQQCGWFSQLGESRFVTVKSWQPICINFYLWGDVKDKVYKICSCNEEELNIWKFFWNNYSFKSISDFLNSIIKVCVFRQHFSTSLNTGALTLIVWFRMTHIGKIL